MLKPFHYQESLPEISQRIGTISSEELEQRIEQAKVRYGDKFESYAVCIYRTPHLIGSAFNGRNGDLVFAIFRRKLLADLTPVNNVITVMLRRKNQSCTPAMLGVERVFWMG